LIIALGEIASFRLHGLSAAFWTYLGLQESKKNTRPSRQSFTLLNFSATFVRIPLLCGMLYLPNPLLDPNIGSSKNCDIIMFATNFRMNRYPFLIGEER